ncbi:MAG TPA: hypothetical protein VNV36_21755 [Pseudomonas sp.]|uniref:hypothetical protein n=1 Tax=Pseudomonas sp. TaxID=306 RepID=UPI002C2C1E93|nr:hypothetical protein [Pseudomonas sp.]HWH89384.1 hypothetical protein [Pseudomonas sp.]
MHLSLGGYQLACRQFCVARSATVRMKLRADDYAAIKSSIEVAGTRHPHAVQAQRTASGSNTQTSQILYVEEAMSDFSL